MRTTSPLRVVPPTPEEVPDRFLVAAQISAAGPQGHSVRVVNAMSGPEKGQIAVRVGRVLVYVANREALSSFLKAWAEASRLADEAFGPDSPPPAYRPKN